MLHRYIAEFSKPTSSKPVPLATVKVYFTITFGEKPYGIKYKFENESLEHKPGKSLRTAQIETWIDRIYNDKIKIREMMNLVTDFEKTRLVPPVNNDDEEDPFYAGCSLLESTVGEVPYHDEIDDETNSIYELMLRYITETAMKGVSETKQRITKISTFNAIAQVLGKAEETGKRGGEKTQDQKYTEFFKLYPHIATVETRIGKLSALPEQGYYYERNEEGRVEKLPIDQVLKRHKKEAQLFEEMRLDGSTTECIYKGEWNKKKSSRDGRGILIWPEGIYYFGYLHDDKINGYGRLIHRLEDVYEGDWFNGKAYGSGTYYHSNGIKWTGNFSEDLLHGEGSEEWIDGSLFQGYWEKGIKEGFGKFTWNNGSVYEGYFRNSLMSGKGEYTWQDGRKYTGEFSNGKLNGKGAFVWPDGRRFEGNYVNDEKHGYGELYWPDGRIFKGKWERGVQHGEGFYTSLNGETKRGLWKNGERQKWYKDN